ncbi:MAG: methionine--tRNA ligase [Rhodothermales bacterium]|nr:methionine--tRNA ligase [Rhodothermales bacterium]
MATEKLRHLVTSALPYANGPVHVGHLAGAYLPADLYCRYLRLKGHDVAFICGSDEMGVAIMIRAMEDDVSPQSIVDRYHPMIQESFAAFGMSFDYYGRTTSAIHRQTSQEFFTKLADDGVFVTRTAEQLFDPEAGIFLADRFVKGTCPVCGFEEAYGDQCERCGSSLSPMELIEPRSTLSSAIPELRESTHWYLPLGDFQERLEAWLSDHPEWKPNVLGQVRSWLQDGLRERAITRDVPWGVPVPLEVGEAEGIDTAGKVIYVWFDAPIGYISATKEWALEQGTPDLWKEYWQNEDCSLVHFIGKDNIVFHCLMFPAMLMAHGGYVLPENVPANEFLNLEGKKLSTSRNWAVWLHEYLEAFDPDLLRYVLASTLPESKDADFNWRDFQTRVNSELADVLGNFVNRTMTFATRYFEGRVPPLKGPSEIDLDVLRQLGEFPGRIGASYEAFRLREAVFETMGLARLGNKYFNDTEPWHTRKSDLEACANSIHVSLQICATIAVLLDPVLPFAADKIRRMLNLDGIRSSVPGGASGSIGWDDAATPILVAGHRLGEAEILFSKLEDDVIEEQLGKLGGPAEEGGEEPTVVEPAAKVQPVKPEIVYDDFAKLDFRVGRIIAAEAVPKADRLLRLDVDLGFETRQVIAGIAEHHKAEDIVGRSVVALVNLQPRKLRGLESQGMILMAEEPDGSLVFVQTDAETGSRVF